MGSGFRNEYSIAERFGRWLVGFGFVFVISTLLIAVISAVFWKPVPLMLNAFCSSVVALRWGRHHAGGNRWWRVAGVPGLLLLIVGGVALLWRIY